MGASFGLGFEFAVFAEPELFCSQISNLKKVLKGILDYNQEVRARTCPAPSEVFRTAHTHTHTHPVVVQRSVTISL